MYEVLKQERRGPFGIFWRNVSQEKLDDGQSLDLSVGKSGLHVELGKAGLKLKLLTKSPVDIKYAAEPERLRPKFHEELYIPESEARTDRSRLTIKSQGNHSERIVFKGKKFEPLTVNVSEAMALIVDTMRQDSAKPII